MAHELQVCLDIARNELKLAELDCAAKRAKIKVLQARLDHWYADRELAVQTTLLGHENNSYQQKLVSSRQKKRHRLCIPSTP